MKVRVLQGMATRRRRTPLENAYDQFRPEQGNRLSQRTLASYDYRVDGFFSWLRSEHPQVRQFKDLTGGAYGYVAMGPYMGGQAERVRVPYADFNCLKLPAGTEHEADFAMLADIFPTG